jgi:hypothetical protein
VIAAPVYQIFTAVGIIEVARLLRGKFIYVGYLLLAVTTAISFYLYYHRLIVDYSKAYSQAWQYGYKQVVNYIKNNQDKYDLIVFTRSYGEPHMFTLFFSKYSPDKYQKAEKVIQVDPNDWIKIYSFDKYLFPDLSEPGTMYEDIVKKYPGKKILFVGKHEDFVDGQKVLLNVKFLDESNVFDVVERK